MAGEEDTSTLLPKEEKPASKINVGTLLYYARAVDPTMLVYLESNSVNQAKSNETTYQAITKMLDYCATHPDSTVRYKQSDMVLYVYSAGFYLSEYQNHIRCGRCFFKGRKILSRKTKIELFSPYHELSKCGGISF